MRQVNQLVEKTVGGTVARVVVQTNWFTNLFSNLVILHASLIFLWFAMVYVSSSFPKQFFISNTKKITIEIIVLNSLISLI